MGVKLSDLLGEYRIEIPANGIAQAGIDKIQSLLCEWGLGMIPEIIPGYVNGGDDIAWCWDWKINGKGEYVGTLPKRIAKVIWQARAVKLTPKQLSELGNIGAAYSGKHDAYYFDIVNHFNWNQDDFGQPDTCCFWSCHASAKDMIHENGGGAIRFFKSTEYSRLNGIARAWLAPWQDCWIMFNGYGMETLAIARILAAHLDHSYYRKIELRNYGEYNNNLWINGGTGYLIGPQESVLANDTYIDLEWENIPNAVCFHCGCEIDENNHYHSPANNDYCESCWEERCFVMAQLVCGLDAQTAGYLLSDWIGLNCSHVRTLTPARVRPLAVTSQ